MNKTLRIFAKDTRHLWPEILLSLALTVGFAATDHFTWPQFQDYTRQFATMNLWLSVLMVVSWWLLIARTVHDESLVGDRQFWITRPYAWPRVLAAKLIFATLFIAAPYFFAQCFILHQAGFYPVLVLPGLFFRMGLLAALVLLPLFALSTVTSTLTRMFVVLFSFAIYVLLAVYLSSNIIFKRPVWTPGDESPWWIVFFYLIPAVCMLVILIQYARRRTALSIWLLAGLVVTITAASVTETYSKTRQRSFLALSAGETAPLQITFDPDPKWQLPSREDYGGLGYHGLVLNISGIAPGHVVEAIGRQVSVEADGLPFTTLPWEQLWDKPYTNGSRISPPGELPEEIFRKTAGKLLTIHITYAILEEASESEATVAANDQFHFPGGGLCSRHEGLSRRMRRDTFACQYALRGPGIIHVSWDLHNRCEGPPSVDKHEEDWINGSFSENSDLSPLINISTRFGVDEPSAKAPPLRFCPGTPLTFAKYHVLRQRLVEVTLPPIDPHLYLSINTGDILMKF